MSEWKRPEYVQPDTPVLVHGLGRITWAVAKYTHKKGWVLQTDDGWHAVRPPNWWMPLPASPDLNNHE